MYSVRGAIFDENLTPIGAKRNQALGNFASLDVIILTYRSERVKI
jgi:hypothetical protein